MGKSLAAIAATLVLHTRDNKPILIIAPQVLHQHWAGQIYKFINDADAVEEEAKHVIYTHEKITVNGRKKQRILISQNVPKSQGHEETPPEPTKSLEVLQIAHLQHENKFDAKTVKLSLEQCDQFQSEDMFNVFGYN